MLLTDAPTERIDAVGDWPEPLPPRPVLRFVIGLAAAAWGIAGLGAAAAALRVAVLLWQHG